MERVEESYHESEADCISLKVCLTPGPGEMKFDGAHTVTCSQRFRAERLSKDI
jgi:hypothetical protein